MRIKIALAQMEVLPGRPRANLERMLEYLGQAKERAADIVVYPELAIPGRCLGDLWEYEWFLHECEECGQELINASDGIIVVFGNVAVDWKQRGADGKARKYNACFAAYDGTLADNGGLPYKFCIKTAGPDCRQSDDSRYFYDNVSLALERNCSPAELIRPFSVAAGEHKFSLGCLIGEDGWSGVYPAYKALAEQRPDLLLNISSVPFAPDAQTNRLARFSGTARKAAAPFVYINHTGTQNNGRNIYVYAGSGCAIDPSGEVAAAFPAFSEGLFFLEYDRRRKIFTAGSDTQKLAAGEIAEAIIYGTKRFLAQCRIERMTVGLSGGIDSAVAASLYTHILGCGNVLLLNMPSRYNSAATISLSGRLADNLGAHYAGAPIDESVGLTVRQIGGIEVGGQRLDLSPLALENVQARDRARLLAAAASAFGGGFSCNSNKSELTVGYGTFYGDLTGLVAPLGDLWKHQVYALGRYFNQTVFRREVIPEEIFNITPSAELSAEQTVGTGGDPMCYPYHDCLFKAFAEQSLSPLEISQWHRQGRLAEELGCAPELVDYLFAEQADFFTDLERWWLAFCGLAAAKRAQAPPVITVSARAFGFERREAQNAVGLPAEYLLLKQEMLGCTR